MKSIQKIRTIVFGLLLIPYIISLIGIFSSYFAFFHRTQFQLAVESAQDNQLELLVFSSAGFKKIGWTEDKKEFEWEGRMFDVARIDQKGNTYFVYCENDSLEDLLISYLNSNGGKTTGTLILHVSFFEAIKEFDCSNFFTCAISRDCNIVNFYDSVPGELNTPPPKDLPTLFLRA